MKVLSVVGATGSIGLNVLDVVRSFPEQYRVAAMAAGNNTALMAQLVKEFGPELVAMASEDSARELQRLLPDHYHDRVLWGSDGCCQVAAFGEVNMTISAIVGAAGLLPTLAAIEAGKDIGLANKETLVMAGGLVMAKVKQNNVKMLPVDSEHSAIFQALEAGRREDLRKIILTASGGPFRGMQRDQLRLVSRQQALAHPNWSMGAKISIDSATLMNKGLEVIEAHWLFGVETGAIEVVVHPQSIVHSLVEFCDGSILAHLGIPDMRIPIGYALSYPERLPLMLQPLDLVRAGRLDFFEPDNTSFPGLQLAFAAISSGGIMPAVLNAANEVAVTAFLESRLGFLEITETVARTMDIVPNERADSLEAILEADRAARREAEAIIVSRS
jgi:1-deoxy-D-xylulose-5-phosphate reductoisomerase